MLSFLGSQYLEEVQEPFLEHEQTLIRKSVLKLLSGQTALKMDVESLPMNEDALNAQIALQKSMNEAFAGRGALNVIVKNDGAAS